MKGKVKLPKGFKYFIDRESGLPTPTVVRKISKEIKQSFYLPILPSGEVLPVSYNWQVQLDKIEINFLHRLLPHESPTLQFAHTFINDTEGDYTAEFNSLRPADDTFDAQTNHFTKPKRLAKKVLHSYADDIKFPTSQEIRLCCFYLLKQHKSICDKRMVELTETFLNRIKTPETTKEGCSMMWHALSPQLMRDGTIQ